jgi:hypothetical protein
LCLEAQQITEDLENFSYNEVSEMSEVTQESYPEGYDPKNAVEDIADF